MGEIRWDTLDWKEQWVLSQLKLSPMSCAELGKLLPKGKWFGACSLASALHYLSIWGLVREAKNQYKKYRIDGDAMDWPELKDDKKRCLNCNHLLFRAKTGLQHEVEYSKEIDNLATIEEQQMYCAALDGGSRHCDCSEPLEGAVHGLHSKPAGVEEKIKHSFYKGWANCECLKCCNKRASYKDMGVGELHKQPTNGKKNPYSGYKNMAKHVRWQYWMTKYRREPPEEKHVRAKKLGISSYAKDELTPAQKAWVTRRKNDPKLRVTKDYDLPKKNALRTIITRSFRKIGGTCLALESPDFYFAKELSDMKFVIFENNKMQYRKMKGNTPSNVKKVVFADVNKAPELAKDEVFSCAFLDYCKTFQTHEKDLIKLKDKLSTCRKIALTFALRSSNPKTSWGDYQYDLGPRLLEIFDKYNIEGGKGYRDNASMVTLVLARKDYTPRKRTKWGKYKTIGTRVSTETKKKIRAWADEKYWTESEVIRRVLDQAKEVN